MRLQSARDLKQELIADMIEPLAAKASRARTAGIVASALAVSPGAKPPVFGIAARPIADLPMLHRSVALGVAGGKGEYRLAVRVQRPGLMQSEMVEQLRKKAKGEVDLRMIGRIAKRTGTPWYRSNTRPLQIGASIGHFKITAGTLGAFARKGSRVCILSNNHVLANEDMAKAGDWILQRGRYDGGRQPGERVAKLRHWVRFKKNRANLVDCALAVIERGMTWDDHLLRGIVRGHDRQLAGLNPDIVDEGETVYKLGRTTGPTEGRVTAFDVDNVVVDYDVGNLRFDGQVEIEGAGDQAFSDGGDSGSLIVNADMKAVALLFAGGETGGSNGLGLTYANPIHHVLGALKATLL